MAAISDAMLAAKLARLQGSQPDGEAAEEDELGQAMGRARLSAADELEVLIVVRHRRPGRQRDMSADRNGDAGRRFYDRRVPIVVHRRHLAEVRHVARRGGVDDTGAERAAQLEAAKRGGATERDHALVVVAIEERGAALVVDTDLALVDDGGCGEDPAVVMDEIRFGPQAVRRVVVLQLAERADGEPARR